jgi:isoquinoline 1-oxidoreductase subunit alpha
MPKLNINGLTRDVDAEAETPLLWVLREQLGLTGTKYGCGVAQCGACSVHINGEVRRSCSIPLASVGADDRIVTIEGLSRDRSHPVQQAWAEFDVPQCGYCQAGARRDGGSVFHRALLQALASLIAAALLAKTAKPSDADIDAALTNICRCGTYQRIRAAVYRAAAIKLAKA